MHTRAHTTKSSAVNVGDQYQSWMLGLGNWKFQRPRIPRVQCSSKTTPSKNPNKQIKSTTETTTKSNLKAANCVIWDLLPPFMSSVFLSFKSKVAVLHSQH